MPVEKAITSGFVDVPGARLYYERAGEGDPVLLLHGGLLDRRMWDEQFPFFAQHSQTIRYDMHGSGESQSLPSTASCVPYQDAYHLLQALALQHATLVGLSGGARFAIDLAIAHPEVVRKLVLVSPGMSGYQFVDVWTGQRAEELKMAVMQGDLARAVEVFLVMWTDGPFRSPKQVDHAVRERIREMATHSMELGAHALPFHELEPPASGRLAEIHVPTLIVLGDRDTSDIQAIGKQLHQQVAGSELVTMPGVGHTLVMEKPVEFNVLAAQFLHG
jgi:pimeloyl-ACP methyl ester carboxylesterase